MNKAEFVYVTCIKLSREKVWQAFTDESFTTKYLSDHVNASGCNVGSSWQHRDADDASLVDIAGVVIERDPARRLVISWASPSDVGNAEKTSRVTFDLAQAGELVRLTVTHGDLEAGSGMHNGISGGWPQVLASLKSVLETGEALPAIWTRGVGKWEVVEFA